MHFTLAGLSPKTPFKSPKRPPKSPRDRLSAPGHNDNSRPNVSSVKENNDIQLCRKPTTNAIHHRAVPNNIKEAVRNFTTPSSNATNQLATADDLVAGLENLNIGDSNDNISFPAAEINDNDSSIASKVRPDCSNHKKTNHSDIPSDASNPFTIANVNIITTPHEAKKNTNEMLDIEEFTATQTDTISKQIPSCNLNALRERQELHNPKAGPIIYIYYLYI